MSWGMIREEDEFSFLKDWDMLKTLFVKKEESLLEKYSGEFLKRFELVPSVIVNAEIQKKFLIVKECGWEEVLRDEAPFWKHEDFRKLSRWGKIRYMFLNLSFMIVSLSVAWGVWEYRGTIIDTLNSILIHS
jgi:hypothetical protein